MLSEKDIPLIADIETSLKMDLSLTPETASRFLDHFENYISAMKEAGIYDPSVIRQMWNPDNSWERSV
jgi:hypothetical protein